MWFWKKKKSPEERKSGAERKLDQIEQLLFPPFSTESTPEGMIFHVDYSVDSNLDGALTDLKDGTNDATVQNSINASIKKLMEVRKILEAYPFMDKRAQYVIVDTPPNDDDVREAKDEYERG
jgi:hypothetical protein